MTGNIELTKDSLHRNYNYLSEKNAGQKFLRKVLNHQKAPGVFSVDLVGAIHAIEDRFLDDSDKQLSMTILKSLARGQTVNVTKI